MMILFSVMIFVLGLCCGSFINMLVYRTAIGYGLEKRKFKVKNKDRSYCDYCGRQLRWYENIPVISWLMQKGKTRCCNKKLPVLYPIVELTVGILFLLNFRFLISNFQLINLQIIIRVLLGFIIITFLVFSSIFDLKYMILPDFSTVLLIIVVFVFLLLEMPYMVSLQENILFSLISFGFLGFLYLITKKKGMGLGDVKLAFFMGLLLGKRVVIAFYIAFISGALVALFLMVIKKANKKTLVPFGPFLILGTLLSWFFSNYLTDLSVFSFIF